jgi:hypothetical protein
MIAVAAWGYALCCGGIVLFQLALIGGAPWGAATQGGRITGVLDRRGRLIALLSVPVLVFQGLAILSAAGVGDGYWPRWTGWAALAVTCIALVLNLITPSRIERAIWVPVILVMALLGAVAMGAPS